ncbi:1-deoxy-D-xylulose-5-phosphate reductoisomerase [Garicola koreensis]|uniref:1-deoxy-D-xylulose 5-phosphate reductoisomerase n=1 Tax=Garicola koreensis TaxID=1262554 RepID=A0A7W5TRW8_9MICC|nr:1-deoxy-D-xylulose-5-phosphate reductoisomerase [Garicola koreensis]MBB3667512.1 1-deoxy-D-xylulose-5-phosphate reductoisomerase [Garicola koreensis]
MSSYPGSVHAGSAHARSVNAGPAEPAPTAGRRRRVAILGSTGSIGTQALQVIAEHPDEFDVVALCAGTNAALLAEQVRTFTPAVVGMHDDDAAQQLRRILDESPVPASDQGRAPEVLSGAEASERIAGEAEADVVLNAMTGSIGLRPTLAALRAGATLALANKESLVVGGALVKDAVQRPGQVVPVDSEHSAVAQALASGRHERGLCSLTTNGTSEVRRLVLTASGGPFRGWDGQALAAATPAQALKHPNFAMGLMVTTNSATMVNKALEVVEAHLLFDVALADIETVIHPQQYIHSLVEFHDGSTLAQAGPPRMLVPIALGLSWPQRLKSIDTPIDWTHPMQWDFEPLDQEAFPAVSLAKQAASTSATHMAVYNAANEQAVTAFHAERLPFTGILAVVEQVLAAHTGTSEAQADLDAVLAAEQWARSTADRLVQTGGVG